MKPAVLLGFEHLDLKGLFMKPAVLLGFEHHDLEGLFMKPAVLLGFEHHDLEGLFMKPAVLLGFKHRRTVDGPEEAAGAGGHFTTLLHRVFEGARREILLYWSGWGSGREAAKKVFMLFFDSPAIKEGGGALKKIFYKHFPTTHGQSSDGH